MTRHVEPNTLVVTPELDWVRLNKYCQDSGDTKQAVYARRKKGLWLDGIQCQRGPDRKLWINIKEVVLWIQHGNANLPARLKSRRGSRPAIPKPATA